MPRPVAGRNNRDIVDWAKTVQDTISQLGNKSTPKPKIVMPKAGSSIGFGAASRNTSRIASANRRRNLAAVRKRRKGTVNRNIR